MRNKREIRTSRFKIAFIHAASPICLAVLGLFLFTHCYKGGGGINPYLGDRLPPDISDGLALPAPPPCPDTSFSGSGSLVDPYIVCSPDLFYEAARNNMQGVIYILSQDIDLGGAAIGLPPFAPMPGAPCGDPMALQAFFIGDSTRIINYRLDLTESSIYHPTERQADLFGACAQNVSGVIVDPRSPTEVISAGCGAFVGGEMGAFGLRYESESGPLVLCSREQLEAIDDSSASRAESYIMLGDLDLANNEYSASVIDGNFNGTFDGNNNTIRNISIDSGAANLGLFNSLGDDGVIRNLKLEGVIIIANSYENLGGFAAESSGTIENCSLSNASFDLSEASDGDGDSGGFVGEGLSLTIRDSYVENLTITGAVDKLGGMVGHVSGTRFIPPTAALAGRNYIPTLIERCYVANSFLSPTEDNMVANDIGGLIGAIRWPLGATGAARVPEVNIRDSYTWENVIGSLAIAGGSVIGGLVGFISIGSDISGTSMSITNSYTSYQYLINAEGGATSGSQSGGLVGYTDGAVLAIRNSFSPSSFGGWRDDDGDWSAQSAVGGLLGSRSPAVFLLTIHDSYFTGRINCIPRSRWDGCGGLGGALSAGAYDAYDFERSYSTAEIVSISSFKGANPLNESHDGVGLLFGGGGGRPYTTATGGITSDSLYFVRDRIRARGSSIPLDSTNRYIQSASQACYDIAISSGTGSPNGACLDLPANDNIGSNAGTNRGLTKAQMQTVPSGSTDDGNSPAKLGDAFLYTSGWCPRVCRRGVSPCTDETSLVGFDASGQPLPGPGGGLIAQANNEGDKCFDVEPIELDDIPNAPPPPTAGPPPPPPPVVPMVSRACTVTGNFTTDFIFGGGSASAHSAPSDPSANDTLSVFAGARTQQTVGTASSVAGTAAALNLTSDSFVFYDAAGSSIYAVLEITALDVNMPGTLCMDENTSEITLDATQVVSGGTPTAISTVPNGTHTGGNPSGNTMDGCTLEITQAAAMTGEVAEFELQNCIFVIATNTPRAFVLVSAKFRVAIP